MLGRDNSYRFRKRICCNGVKRNIKLAIKQLNKSQIKKVDMNVNGKTFINVSV